jgi:hypothetical protein
MDEYCAKTCQAWKLKYQAFRLKPDEFYELASTNAATNKIVDFERFEGYVTFIVPLARMCRKSKDPKVPSAKQIFEQLEHIKQVYKYSVEVLVFPYDHPREKGHDQTNNDDDDDDDDAYSFDCTEFNTLMQQQNRNIYVFQKSHLTRKSRGGKQLDKVFQLLLERLNLKEFNFETQFYFILQPDGMNAFYHFGLGLEDMQDIIGHSVKTLGGREL